MNDNGTTERQCAGCGDLLVRKTGEYLCHYKARKTCSRECRYRVATAKTGRIKTERAMSRLDERFCVECGALLARRTDEPLSNFRKRDRCGRFGSCAEHEASRGRTCIICNVTYQRRPGEGPKRFAMRETCSRQCATRLRRSRQAEKHAGLKRNCETCHRLIDRGALAITTYRKRRFCSQECANAAPSSKREDPAPKPCVICGAMMSYDRARQPNVTTWKQTETCGHECAVALVAQRNYKHEPAKQCPICQAVFSRREDEHANEFRSRKTCSKECSLVLRGQTRKGAYQPHECKICGEPVTPYEGEKTTTFNRRKTCSESCRLQLSGIGISRTRLGLQERRNPYPPEWSSKLRRMIRDRDGNVCQLCGATPGQRTFPVHHIDYNKQHVHPSNLITLCDPCHAKTNYDRSYWEALLTTFMAEREDIAA